MITVTIPVGPEEWHRAHLDECLASVRAQTRPPDEVLIIDDMAAIFPQDAPGCRIWQAPWRLGVAHAFNFGVALAHNPLVLMLGSDDLLAPQAVARCIDAYGLHQKDAYYYLPLIYAFRDMPGMEDHDEVQHTRTNAAMVTKTLWRQTGGFPPESALGPCDYIMAEILELNGFPSILVDSPEPLYWYRIHAASDSVVKKEIFKAAGIRGTYDDVRRLCLDLWRRPEWGRLEGEGWVA